MRYATGMSNALHDLLESSLHSEDQLRVKLHELSQVMTLATGRELAARAPDDADVVVALPEAAGLARAVAAQRGLSMVRASREPIEEVHLRATDYWLPQAPLAGKTRALLVSAYLESGLPEVQIAAGLRQLGLEVVGLACAAERTGEGRNHLEVQAVPVTSVVQIAGTPRGLVFDRRSVE